MRRVDFGFGFGFGCEFGFEFGFEFEAVVAEVVVVEESLCFLTGDAEDEVVSFRFLEGWVVFVFDMVGWRRAKREMIGYFEEKTEGQVAVWRSSQKSWWAG